MEFSQNLLLVITFFFVNIKLIECIVYCPPNDDMIRQLKGFDLNYTYPCMYSGFVEVEHQTDSNLFYWFFREENGNTNAPLVLWINGGPGSSSMLGNLLENGPLRLVRDEDSNTTNVHSLKGQAWSAVANVVYVDQPVGVGFSYGHRNISSGQELGDHMVNFVLGFYKKFPDMKNSKFYISGESYGGKYLPAIANSIIRYNKNATSADKIPLFGVLIGNGFVDPLVQFTATRDFPLSNGQIQFDSLPEFDTIEQRCLTQNANNENDAVDSCFKIPEFLTVMNGGMDIYDARYNIVFEIKNKIQNMTHN